MEQNWAAKVYVGWRQAGESIGDNSTDDDTLAVKVLVGR